MAKNLKNDQALLKWFRVKIIFNWYDHVLGGSLAAAESLIKRECQVAINWGGGWHHGQRDEASGFCYVNDIVLAIQHLRQEFDRVLYVDLDVHHGDGVENAFSFSPKIFTFSIHKFEAGYFPGSGNIADIGQGKGKFYSLNIPLKDGIDDATYVYIFERCLITLFLLNNFIQFAFFTVFSPKYFMHSNQTPL